MSGKTKLWILVTTVISGLVLMRGVLAGLLPQLRAAAAVRAEVGFVDATIAAQEGQLARLRTAADDPDGLANRLAELERALPAAPEWPAFLRELEAMAVAAGIEVTEIRVQPMLTGGDSGGALPSDPPEADGSSDSGSETGTDAGESPPPVGSSRLVDGGGRVEIPLTIRASGDVEALASFFRQLQTADRLFLAQRLELDAPLTAAGDPALGVITGTIFTVPSVLPEN